MKYRNLGNSGLKVSEIGLGGSIAINICGSLVLLGWLVLAPPAIPLRGTILLWGIGILVLGLGLVELAAKS